MLKAAASNFMFTRSVNLNTFDRVMSVDQSPGPTNVFRPRFPVQSRAHGVVNEGRFAWLRVVAQPLRIPPPFGHQPFAQVERLMSPKPLALLLGRSLLARSRL